MEKTYILGNSKPLSQLAGTFIEVPKFNSNEDSLIHDWIIQLFEKNEIEKVVIEVDENPKLSFQIGFHIRLSIEDLGDKVLVPILFLSHLTLNSVIQHTEIASHIVATKGVAFSEFNLNENQKEIKAIEGIKDDEYLTGFLKRIFIQPDETIGRHSLANIWGAYALDKAANTSALPISADFKKKLYFKYISGFNSLHKLRPAKLKKIGNINDRVSSIINAKGRRILLIDDEANKGWETVLRKVFMTSYVDDFVVINEKVKDFDSLSEKSKNIIKKEQFDLYLIDLRLNGLDEDDNYKTDDLSGMKILRKIKSINNGNQVVIFSASNKIWNLEPSPEPRWDGYYLKESPDFKFSSEVSKRKFENFKKSVEYCFNKTYLRNLYIEWEEALMQIKNPDLSFIEESSTSLKLSWELLKRGYLDFGFLTLFQSVESYANKLYTTGISQDILDGKVTIDKSKEGVYEWIMTYREDFQNGDYFFSEKKEQERTRNPTTLFKVSCLLGVKYKMDDSFLKRIGYLNARRNKIAHKGARKFVSVDDLKEILRLIAVIRSN